MHHEVNPNCPEVPRHVFSRGVDKLEGGECSQLFLPPLPRDFAVL
jgi:hypothetical protein